MSTSSRRARRRSKGLPNWRIVRNADDCAVLVHGTENDVHALREDIGGVLATMGLFFSEDKTRVVNMAEGFDFLGVPHPMAPQTRHEHLARLHLHC